MTTPVDSEVSSIGDLLAASIPPGSVRPSGAEPVVRVPTPLAVPSSPSLVPTVTSYSAPPAPVRRVLTVGEKVATGFAIAVGVSILVFAAMAARAPGAQRPEPETVTAAAPAKAPCEGFLACLRERFAR
jgi:hypothetical protein